MGVTPLLPQEPRPAAPTLPSPCPQMSTGAFSYLVFCGVCLLVALYVYLIVPETKNKTFMEISRVFAARQPLAPLCHAGMLRLRGYGAVESSLEGSEHSLP